MWISFLIKEKIWLVKKSMKINSKIVNQINRTFHRKMKMKKEDIDFMSNLKKYISLILNSSPKKQEIMRFRYLCLLKNLSKSKVVLILSAKASIHSSFSSLL